MSVTADEQLDLLTGPDTAGLLQAALDTAQGELLEWSALEVDHRPGRSTTVSYRAHVKWPDGERSELLGASTGLGPVESFPPGVIGLSDGTNQVAVWLSPLDPWLPALAGAYTEETVRTVFKSSGLGDGPVRLNMVSYRPGRRAVIEARSATASIFLKAVRPHEVENLHNRHVLLHDAGLPVARSLGWNADGLLVLEELKGTPMRRRLRKGSADVPEGNDLLRMLERLPEAVKNLPRQIGWSDEVDHFAAILAAALPPESARVKSIASRMNAGLADFHGTPDAVHGDLYEGQLILEGSRVSGLLDVDTVGPGRRADDLACLLAHLLVQAQAEPGHEATTQALAARWLVEFDSHVDPVELRYRTAGVIISLATGPHRVQENDWPTATRDRIALAEAWVRSAERIASTRAQA